MKIIITIINIIIIITSNCCYSISVNEIKVNPGCAKYIKLYKTSLSSPIVIQDVLQFVLNEGYSSIDTRIGNYLLTKGYRDYAQYCIEHICSSAISNMIKLYRLKPKEVSKAYLDYTYIGKRNLANISYPGKYIDDCAKSLNIDKLILIKLIDTDYNIQLKQVIFGLSHIETKLDDIIILS